MNDDDRRFVIGHLNHGHSKTRFRTTYLARAARTGVARINNAPVARRLATRGGLVESPVNAQYSPADALESDGDGPGLLRCGDFEPQAAVAALAKRDDAGHKTDVLSSQPGPASRARRIQAQIR